MLRRASEPFRFALVSYLIRIDNQKASNLNELLTAIDQASDGSIFYHTFQTLGEHHFLAEGFSNDFAQWVLAALNRPELAELLAGIDIRDYLSLAELRADLRRMIADYCKANPRHAELSAFEPFYFSEGVEVVVPPQQDVWTLHDFRDGLSHMSHASFHYHFITSRLRLQLRTNDFSLWLANSMGLNDLASQINRIDIYTHTLDTAREEITQLVDGELNR